MSRHERAAVMMELGLSNYLIVSMLFEQPILCNPAWTQHGQKGFLHQGPADWEGGEWKRQGQWTRLPEREACWDRPGRISESDQSRISLCVFRMMSHSHIRSIRTRAFVYSPRMDGKSAAQILLSKVFCCQISPISVFLSQKHRCFKELLVVYLLKHNQLRPITQLITYSKGTLHRQNICSPTDAAE